jgi:aryl-alcohol dehydrogenase-like predicted oxidoreductase
VVPWSPLARGFLAGSRPKEGAATKRASSDSRIDHYFGSAADYAILKRVRAAAERLGASPAQVACAWVLSKPGITAPIVGATRLEQLDNLIAAVDLRLDHRMVKLLESPYKPRLPAGHG